MRKHGVISKATKEYVVRFTPPLVITKAQVDEVTHVVDKSL
jgi:acetylornithine/succinyldiaminopimelate/putrescine aminotransferase